MDRPLLFKFVKMELTQFAIFENNYTEDNTELEIFNRFQFAYNFDDHLVLCKTVIEISQQGKLLLKADLDSIFKIETESASEIEKDNEAVIPQGLLAQFASLAYGSMRGVLYFKTEDTPFSKFILPPNDMSSIFKESQTFSRHH